MFKRDSVRGVLHTCSGKSTLRLHPAVEVEARELERWGMYRAARYSRSLSSNVSVKLLAVNQLYDVEVPCPGCL